MYILQNALKVVGGKKVIFYLCTYTSKSQSHFLGTIDIVQ